MFGEQKGFTRTITVTGKAAENTYFRLASTGGQKTSDDGWISIGSDLSLKVVGGDPITRETATGKETLLLVSGSSAIQVSYRWNK